jgi:hypothetical protein
LVDFLFPALEMVFAPRWLFLLCSPCGIRGRLPSLAGLSQTGTTPGIVFRRMTVMVVVSVAMVASIRKVIVVSPRNGLGHLDRD